MSINRHDSSQVLLKWVLCYDVEDFRLTVGFVYRQLARPSNSTAEVSRSFS